MTPADRPLHVAVGCLAAGLALSPFAPRTALIAAAATGTLVLLGCRRAPGRTAPALAAMAAAALLAGAAFGEARLRSIEAPAARVRDGPVRQLRVYLATPPRSSAFGSSAEVEVSSGPARGVRLLMRAARWAPLPGAIEVGEELAVSGRARELRKRPGAGFDFAAHLRRRRIAAELFADRAAPTGRRRGGAGGLLDSMRGRAERAVAAGLPDPEAALARGMVLGQDEEIDEATRQDWRDSGLAHLLAVSGQNVMLLVALAVPMLALAGAGPVARGVALLALVALYVPLAGAGPSLQRAGVMGAAGIAAMTLSRPASRSYALLLAAAATLALNPRVSADPGWQLSFAAVAGILVLGRPLAAALANAGGELLREGTQTPGRGSTLVSRPVARAVVRALADAVAITVAATLATAPLVSFHFGAVPLSGLIANLLALPAVAPAMWLGMVKVALGLLAAPFPPAGGLAGLLGPLARMPLVYLERLAERCADLPGGRLALPLDSPLKVGVAYVALIVGLVAVRRLLRRPRAGFPERAAAWRRAPRMLRVAVLVLVLAALALVTATGLGSPSPPGDLTVRFLDVGQGDATLIQHPDGTAVLFDGGPPEGGVTRLLRRAGVRRLAIVVATHASRDHQGGLVDVLDRYPVGMLLDGGDGNRAPGLQAVRDEAREEGVRIVPAVAPLSLRAGGLLIQILSPLPRPAGPAPEDPNPRAVVAIVGSGGFELLLSADAESEALLPLALPDVEAMKVPHHGSADPGLPEVLDRLRPEIAAIEVGAHNSYGHPTPSTLSALDHAGVRTYRTDRDGTVSLTVKHGQMHVTTEH